SRSVGGAWPSGKARDFGSRIRRFESSRPSHFRGPEAGPGMGEPAETPELTEQRAVRDAARPLRPPARGRSARGSLPDLQRQCEPEAGAVDLRLAEDAAR